MQSVAIREPTLDEVHAAMRSSFARQQTQSMSADLHRELGGDELDWRARLVWAVGYGYSHRLHGGLQTGFTDPKGTPFEDALDETAEAGLESTKDAGGAAHFNRVLGCLVASVNIGLGLGAGLRKAIPVVTVR